MAELEELVYAVEYFGTRRYNAINNTSLHVGYTAKLVC